MSKLIIYFASLLILMQLTGCSTLTTYHVQSASQNFDYYQGKQILFQQNDNLSTYLNYEHQDGNYFVFYTFIENKGDAKTTIIPSNIFMVTDDSKNYSALDPEKEIDNLVQNQKNLDESHITNTGLNCLFGSFDVITSIAQGEGEQAAEDMLFWADNISDENESYEFDTRRILEAKQFWQNETLRITTLNPGEEVGGLIYFPIDPNTNSFTIIFDTGSEKMKYSFKQIKD